MKLKSMIVIGGISLLGSLMAAEKEEASEQLGENQAKVQLAILLDTSGSMSGLIEQTKSQLWKVVNTFIGAKQNGVVPFVEVALYEYGAHGHAPNHLRKIQPLTRDLDQISEDLFALKTGGSAEYCGAVISDATSQLQWDSSPDVYKAIFIAGNEPFTQGPVKPEAACQEAIKNGIIINTIHCGTEDAGIQGGWKSGALMADGSFLIINHNAAVVHVEAPQDEAIVKLNEDLNKTYLAFGREGKEKAESQVRQDSNAAKVKGGARVGRAVAKASKNYHNANWDLVDAVEDKDFDWSKLKDEELPEEMRKLDLEGRKKFVAGKKTKRIEIQKKIQDLSKERQKFVAAKRREAAEKSGEETLDVVVTKTVREQAKKKGYKFENSNDDSK